MSENNAGFYHIYHLFEQYIQKNNAHLCTGNIYTNIDPNISNFDHERASLPKKKERSIVDGEKGGKQKIAQPDSGSEKWLPSQKKYDLSDANILTIETSPSERIEFNNH